MLSYHAVRANNKSFNVAITEEYDNTLPQIKVIPQDFSRAVLNLMNNACYAVFSKSKGVSTNPYSPTIKVKLAKDGDRGSVGYRRQRLGNHEGGQRETLYAVLHHQTGRGRNRPRPLYH